MSLIASCNIESFTFYSKSGVFYLTGRSDFTVVANNAALLEKGELFQLKFDSKLNISSQLFTSAILKIKIPSAFETCSVRGVQVKRFALEQIEQYENNIRAINQQ